MKKKIIGILVCTLLIAATVLPVAGIINIDELDGTTIDGGGVYAPSAVHPQAIQDAIDDGIAWLAGEQDPLYGSWGTYHQPAITALVLIKLQDYAYETAGPPNPWTGPFDPTYIYYDKVIAGWEYIFTPDTSSNGEYVQWESIGPQEHPTGSGNWDNPDTNGNGYGIYLGNGDHNLSYHTGILLMALVASGDPAHENDGSITFPGHSSPSTFGEIAQDAVDWLAFAQGDDYNPDGACARGGFSYTAIDNYHSGWYLNQWIRPDNSNSGYAYLGLYAAQTIIPRPGATAFACTVPGWVKDECELWVEYIQYTGSNPTYHGGSAYNRPNYIEQINLLKTGNLLFEMTFCGITYPRFDWALDYIERTWHEPILNPIDPRYPLGWGYWSSHQPPFIDPAEYQTMFCLMKGFGYSGITTIDLSGLAGSPTQDWYNVDDPTNQPPYDDFASVLVAQQNSDGSWPECEHSDPGLILSTTWALLVLEKIPKYPGPYLEKWDNIEDCVKPCMYINYTIKVINPSTTFDLHGVVHYDILPSGTSFVEAGSTSPQGIAGCYNSCTNLVTWNIGTMGPDMTVYLYLKVLVHPDVIPGSIIHNVAYVTSDEAATTYAVEDTPVCCCPEIEIQGRIGVTVIIENTNCPDLTNLPWWITIEGGFLGQISKTTTGIITSLASSQSETIKSGIVFGFGPITITVTVDDCPPVTACAFILGRLVIFPR